MKRKREKRPQLLPIHLVFLIFLLFFPVAGFSQSTETALWNALKTPDHFAMIRHALAPGTGDPAEFTIGDCATQRNLSQRGREQAVKMGDRFRQNGIDKAEVYSSQWCRCLETADNFHLGEVRELPVLNSFFRRFEREQKQTETLRQWLTEQELKKPLLLVSHQVNITALTGVYPSSGEIVVVKRSPAGEFTVVGTIETLN